MTRVVPDLSCRDLVELVTEYLEERLSHDDRTRFELHLACCEACRGYLRQMREVVGRAGQLREESISPEARDALLRAFRGWKRGPGG